LPDSPALSQATNPKPSTIVSPDSSSLIAPEDSILDELGAGEGAVLPNGDTIKRRGGYLISENLGVDYYTKNGTRYLRIQRLVGHKPNGHPVWAMRARLRLPPMHLHEDVIAGLCEINGKSDPSVLALTATVEDSTHFQARRAWRFDRTSETLREIPTAGVLC
jgi:hypothetical protein